MIGLLPFQDNLSYFAIDLDRMLRQRPDYIRELFAEVMEHFAAGPLHAADVHAVRGRGHDRRLPLHVAAEEHRQGGRGDGESRSRGCEESRARRCRRRNRLVRDDGTYLITGGLGALGLRVAEWLAEQGAGTIALLVAARRRRRKSSSSSHAIREQGRERRRAAGRRGRRRVARGRARADSAGRAAAARRDSRGRRAGRRHPGRHDARTARPRDAAEGPGRVEPARRHARRCRSISS